MFEKPLGMRDTLPELYETKHKTRTLIGDEIKNGAISLLKHLHLNITKQLEWLQPFWISNCSSCWINKVIPLC